MDTTIKLELTYEELKMIYRAVAVQSDQKNDPTLDSLECRLHDLYMPMRKKANEKNHK